MLALQGQSRARQVCQNSGKFLGAATWCLALVIGAQLVIAQDPPAPLLEPPRLLPATNALPKPTPARATEGTNRKTEQPVSNSASSKLSSANSVLKDNAKTSSNDGLPFTDEQAIKSMDGLLIDIARNAIPMEYENTKDWGKTKERWDGLHISRDGFRIKTKRRKKEVNHGTWKKYEIKNLSPDEFKLDIVNVRKHEDGVMFDVYTEAHLGIFGRLSQWELGVQLISVSADAEARVKLHMECFLRMQFDPRKLPPDVVLDPSVESAQLEIVDFRLKDVSRLGGTLSKQLGKGVREILEDRVVDEPEKLVAKINRQIDKQRDKLRFSLYDLIQAKLKGKNEEDSPNEKTESAKATNSITTR